ncbi:MAG: Multidrug export protein AcrF [Planctomycetota bacterium]
MKLVEGSVRQPVTVVVCVILVVLAGVLALRKLPIQLTPTVSSTIVSVSTFWEGASPAEVERSIVEKQEEKLQGVAGIQQMTSVSTQNSGRVRLEFAVGTDPNDAIREVSDKLRQVASYPPNVDQPVVEASDPENKDYIAWIVLGGGDATDRAFDIRTLQDFAEDRVKPRLERVDGVSEVNVLGGRERELQVRFDAERLAQRSLTVDDLVAALVAANRNASAGSVREAKSEVALRAVGQFESPQSVEAVVIASRDGRAITVGDVAEVVVTYKKPSGFVRSSGKPVIAINVQQEVGSNIVEVMRGVRAAVDEMNADGGLLATETAKLNLATPLTLRTVYDQTTYIDDALALVRDNIWQGGLLATLTLIVFLRSWRAIAIIGVAIPISIIGTVVVLLALGRTVNVISLAGLAFAVGMLVDNSIVVLENIWRHMEMGKSAVRASIDATSEVWGAVLGSTLTTVVVFVPILLIQDEVGQLFRDIAIALSVSVFLSMLVAITVVPAAASRLLKPLKTSTASLSSGGVLGRLSTFTARMIYRVTGNRAVAALIALVLTAASVAGAIFLMPPRDYLPRGNRNLVFGLILPPPGTSLDQQTKMAERIEEGVRPYWEAGQLPEGPEREAAAKALPAVPVAPWMAWKVGPTIQPAPIENYFVVSFPGAMFHGGVAADGSRATANEYLLNHATRAEVLPGTLAFAFQVPLFRTSGSSGSAVRVDFTGEDLDAVTRAAGATFGRFMGEFGPGSVQPDPPSFNLPGPEVRLIPNHRALADAGLSPSQLATAVLAAGDGAIVGEYRLGGESIDMKVVELHAAEAAAEVLSRDLGTLADTPVATTTGRTVQLSTLASVERGTAPTQINHVDRQRAVSLQVTAPQTMALDDAILVIEKVLADGRASGAIPASVRTSVAGSASKLGEIQETLLGDGSTVGLIGSSMFLALFVCYLVMVVLFQSFKLPLVILLSVPLACVGGFAALMAVFIWSLSVPLMPMQTLDVLTMLGFVILIGVVVNNAILIVHQARNFMRGEGDETPSDLAFRGLRGAPVVGKGLRLPPRAAIAESVRTRIRPILMSSLTSVTGLLPLILAPGAGSELYRGLGAVVAGGLFVSTFFTIVLVPLVLAVFTRRGDEVLPSSSA